MKKFTLFLMSLFLTVGAMAQFEAGTEYRIKEKSTGKYLSVGGTASNQYGEVYGADKIEDDAKQIFTFEAANEGTYYVKSKSEEYISYQGTGAGWNVNADPSITNAHELTFEETANNGEFKIKGYNTSKGANKYFKWEHVPASGKYHPFNDDDAGATFIVEKVAAEVEPENRTDYVHNEGSMTRNDRGLKSFTITDGTNSLEVTSIQTSSPAPVYVDKSEQKLTTYPGATLSFSSFNYIGSWMHAYAFVDYNKDYYFEPVDNNGGTTDGEVVSYNYFNGKTITGDAGNQGNAMAGEYNGSKTLPAFTLPAGLEPGEYRMRIKVDWNNLDADYGASDIAANGGAQCDITLVVEEIVGNEVAKAGLASKIEAAIALFNAVTIGDGVGKYSSSIDDAVAEFLAIQEYYNSITDSTPIEEIEAKTARVGEIVASFSLNMPEAGKYYRLKGNSGNYIDASSIYDNATAKVGQMSMKSAGECNLAGTIFYLDNESHLLNYATGTYTRNTREIGAVGDATKSVWAFSESTRTRGKYVLTDNGTTASKNLHDNGGTRADRCSSVCGAAHDWTLEEVTELPVTVTAVGYATLYAPVALTVPTGVTAHTVTLDGEWATLSEALTVVPAETGVVLVAGEGSHNFAITTSDATAASALEGTVAATYVTDDAYVLGVVDEKVGFYTATKNQNEGAAFLNNANKAYLPKTAGMSAASYSFRFGEGTTGIENVEVENAVKAIYDLTGRKVEAISAPGIYIVNGVKRVVR